MAYLYVTYKNHIDLTWRRPRYTAGHTNGYTIVPYSELQERLIDRGFDFIREGGAFSLEQTLSLREYLERNPDCLSEVATWLKDGRLSVLGGGESVIDYNLPDGESVVRNHLYSRLWLKNTFDYTPTLAACPDTFGLSANLPALFRRLGYRGLLEYHRVFEGARPYWRGISGDTVALHTMHGTMPSGFFGGFLKCRVCTICGGNGCDACEGSGLYLDPQPADIGRIADLKDTLLSTDEDYCLGFGGEESMAVERAVPALIRLAEETGRTLRFLSPEVFANEQHADLLDHVDDASADEIDERVEGNPTGTGCYTSRIKLKQENRRCEAALRCAEHLAAAASLHGMPYPAKTFEYWWLRLAFIQFHDALPASHSDDAYDELMEICRRLRAAVSRITRRAAKVLLADTYIEDGDGIPFVVFNPLEFPVENATLSGTLSVPQGVNGGKVILPDGTTCPVLAVRRTDVPGFTQALVDFIGSLPAFGYALCRFIPEEVEESAPSPVRHGCVLENGHLRVTFDDCAITEVYDKDKASVLATEGSFAPWLVDDAGHPWGRTNSIQYEERADVPIYWENMLPATHFAKSMEVERRDGVQIARIRVSYARAEKQIRALDWVAEFTLADTARELSVTITAAFDARDIKLMTQLVLPEPPKNGRLIHEIPLGKVARGRVNAYNEQLGYADEWAALRYVSAPLSSCTVTLCNDGTPAHTIHRYDSRAIAVSLLRTPTQLCCGFGFENAIDPTPHTFRFTLAADTCPMDAYRRGMMLNTHFPSLPVVPQKGTLSASRTVLSLPTNLPLLACKGAEDGDGLILRYLGDETEDRLVFPMPVLPCSILEDDIGDETTSVSVKPYDIVTLRFGCNAGGQA